MSIPPVPVTAVDAFDLPEWLGESAVTWLAEDPVHAGALVAGRLTGAAANELACDLLAVDLAYPAPIAEQQTRAEAHQAWQHGQVLLVERSGRLTLAVPGTGFSADLVLEVLERLARAVGARPENYLAGLRIGGPRRR